MHQTVPSFSDQYKHLAHGTLDLDFDVDTEVLRNGHRHRVQDSAFLHGGRCIHVDVLKRFMQDHGVAFQEAA